MIKIIIDSAFIKGEIKLPEKQVEKYCKAILKIHKLNLVQEHLSYLNFKFERL